MSESAGPWYQRGGRGVAGGRDASCARGGERTRANDPRREPASATPF